MIVEMLLIPTDFPCIGIERECGIVIQVLVLGASEQEFRCRRGHGGADEDEIQGRIVARNHPGTDMLPVFVCGRSPHVSLPGSPGAGIQMSTPKLLAPFGHRAR